jgi:hypothetical protein
VLFQRYTFTVLIKIIKQKAIAKATTVTANLQASGDKKNKKIMLLNIFFSNINSAAELVLIGIFLFSMYWFVLRKHNSLGLRMFILCFLVFAACCVWLYKDEAQLKTTLTNGEEYIAAIISKDKINNNDNEVEISFIAKNGKTVRTKTSQYISQAEWNNFETGKPVSVIYLPSTQQTFVEQSIMRFKTDKNYLWFFAGFWLLLGLILMIGLRKMKVGVDEATGDEWVIKKDGSIILDERKSKASKTIKRINILSKFIQAFNK